MALIAASYFTWEKAEELEYRIAGLLGVVFFGACFVYVVLRLVRPRPSLIITDSGIVDYASAVSAGYIRWDEIESIFISWIQVSLRRHKFLSIKLKNDQEFLSRQSALKATMLRANMSLGGAPVAIPGNALPMTLEELMQVIEKKRPGVTVA